MGKISLVSAKYIVHAFISIEGVVDPPDIIGAIFGQTEGLLGEDLELRELQRSGRIGRIEVNAETKSGKTEGEIVVPSSLDKAETAVVAASLETIQRIGPCNATVKVTNIEDVRISKRSFVVDRAKELLHNLTENVLPDSQEITDEVASDVKVMDIHEYGVDRLPAGPDVESSDEIVLVEGRADVLNLLRNGFKNAIAMNGTSFPQSLVELVKTKKEVTICVDGDRGGDLIIKEASGMIDIDYVARAPDGKEIEELAKKELHKVLRSKIPLKEYQNEAPRANYNQRSRENRDMRDRREREYMPRDRYERRDRNDRRDDRQERRYEPRPRTEKRSSLSQAQRETFKRMLDDVKGTQGAYILNEKLDILGKVPSSELVPTLKSLKGVFAVVFDGVVTRDLCYNAERSNVKFLVGMESEVQRSRVNILVHDQV